MYKVLVDAIRDAADQSRPDLEEPGDDEGGPDGPRFLSNGWVRFELASNGDSTARFRLRRPFLGELQDLDLAHEAMLNEMHDISDRARVEGQRLTEQMQKVTDNERLTDQKRSDRLRGLRREDQQITRQFRRDITVLLVGWWQQVFEKVGVDGVPEQWPAWIGDQELPSRVLEHWRQVPLGRGAR